jgi:glutamate racemase
MRIDLLAGAAYARSAMMSVRPPTILVFDSGLGGLTVFAEVRASRPDARFVYAADDAGFPYGRLSPETLVARVTAVMDGLVARHAPDLVVIACNTASTLVLTHLRERFSLPFVGTVPAIKPAAALSRSGHISVLATPGTVARDYTRDLIDTYAAGSRVTLVGSDRLATLAEAALSGALVPDGEIAAEIAPCFVADERGRTDVVVLGCTHYPLLLPRLRAVAPWPVAWLDPAPAIARRVRQLLGDPVVVGGPSGLHGRGRPDPGSRGGPARPWARRHRHRTGRSHSALFLKPDRRRICWNRCSRSERMRVPLVVVSVVVALASPTLAQEPSTTGKAFWGEPGVDGGRCCRTLGEVRENIDRIDRDLVRLMAERGRYVHEAARFKATPDQVEDPKRIEAIVARVRGIAAEQGLSAEVAEATYRAMVGAFTADERGVSAAAQQKNAPDGK